MYLYFMRHGIAEDSHADDASRPLTQNGRENIEKAGRVLQALGVKPTHAFSSPRVRARQTAQIVAETLGCDVEIREEVNFGFNVDAVARLTNGLPEDSAVLFVGHESDMSQTIRALTGGGRVEMKKGSFARVDVLSAGIQPLRGYLVWLIAPKVFNAL